MLAGGAVMGLAHNVIHPGLGLQLREERFPRTMSILRQELQRRERGSGPRMIRRLHWAAISALGPL